MKADKQATAAALQTLVNAQSAGGGNIRSAATPTGRLEVVFWALLMALSESHKVLISIDCVQILITCSIFTLFTRNQYNFCCLLRYNTYNYLPNREIINGYACVCCNSHSTLWLGEFSSVGR